MTNVKSYTDLQQSKKLAEFLPLESADMHYSKDFDGSWFVDLAEYSSVKIPKYVGNVEEHLLPCWSLAALLSVFKDKKYFHRIYSDGVSYVLEIVNVSNPIIREVTNSNNPVDACVAMIEKLHELNLL